MIEALTRPRPSIGNGADRCLSSPQIWLPSAIDTLTQWLDGGINGPWMLDRAQKGTDRILNNGPGLQRGRGVSVNGHNQHLEVSDDAAFDFSGTNAFSLTVLMNSTGSSGWDYILSKRGSNGGFFLALHHSEVKFGFGDGSSNYTVATGHTFVHGADTVLTVTYDGDKGRLYIDGTLVFTSASLGAATLATNTEDLYIGQDNFGGGFLTALVAGIHIYNTDVGQSGASWLAFQGGSKPTGLVGRWLLDEQSGSAHYDSSGNGNNATAYNSPTHSTQNLKSWQNDEGYSKSGAVYIPRDESNTSNDVLGNPLDYRGRAPLHGQLLSPSGTFDGVDDYGDVSHHDNLDYSEGETIKISGRVYAADFSTGSLQTLCYKNRQYNPRISATGEFQFAIPSVSGGPASGVYFTDGEWNDWSVEYNTNTDQVTFTVGISTATVAMSDSPDDATNADLLVGGNPSSVLDGQLCELKIEIDSDTEAHWVWTENSGTTVHDVSGNGHHMTLTNVTVLNYWANTQAVFAYGCANGYRLDSSVKIPGRADGLAADGNALTHPASAFNGASELDHDPYTVPKLDSGNLDGVTPPSAHALGDSVVDAAQHFIRQTATKEDRFLLFSEDLVEPNLSKANSYTA